MIRSAAPPERLPPDVGDEEAEGAERATVGRHGVVVEPSFDDLPQPFPLDGNRLVHAPFQFLLDGFQLRPHAVAPGLPFEQEAALAGFGANVGEA